MLLLLLALGSAAAHAEPGGTFARAVAEAQRCYAGADYACAIDRLQVAYRLKPAARLLFNLGMAQRKAGQARAALDSFERYRAGRRPGDAQVPVERYIEELRAQLAASEPTTATASAASDPTRAPAAAQPPDPAATPASSASSSAAGASIAAPPSDLANALLPAPASLDLAAAPAPRPRPLYRRWWLWTAAAAGAAAVAVAVGVGVTQSRPSEPSFQVRAQ